MIHRLPDGCVDTVNSVKLFGMPATARTRNSTVRCALYLRISEDRAGQELGVDRQREECLRLARSRGWTVSEERTYVDNDVSAYSGKVRPSYQRMLEAMRTGSIDALVAWDPDRLHRRPAELETFISVVEDAGVAIATVVAGDYDLSTAAGRMNARIVGAVARHESEHKAERVRSKQKQSANAGRRHGGRRPYGFTADGSIVETEAAVLRETRDRIFAGESLSAICNDFHAREIVSAGSTHVQGRPFRPQQLRKSLLGARVAGLRQYQGDIVGTMKDDDGNNLPGIITPEDRARLLVLLDTGRAPRGRPTTYLATGLLRCGRCGGVLTRTPMSGGRPDAWRCSLHPGRDDNCGRLSVKADPVDEIVEELVIAALSSAKFRRMIRPRARRGTSEVTRLQRQLEDLDNQPMTRREYEDARADLLRRIEEASAAELPDPAHSALEGLPASAEGIRAWWEARTLDQRRVAAKRVLNHVTIEPVDKGRVFNPDRIVPSWRQ